MSRDGLLVCLESAVTVSHIPPLSTSFGYLRPARGIRPRDCENCPHICRSEISYTWSLGAGGDIGGRVSVVATSRMNYVIARYSRSALGTLPLQHCYILHRSSIFASPLRSLCYLRSCRWSKHTSVFSHSRALVDPNLSRYTTSPLSISYYDPERFIISWIKIMLKGDERFCAMLLGSIR